jgi:hypothetical protein
MCICLLNVPIHVSTESSRQSFVFFIAMNLLFFPFFKQNYPLYLFFFFFCKSDSTFCLSFVSFLNATKCFILNYFLCFSLFIGLFDCKSGFIFQNAPRMGLTIFFVWLHIQSKFCLDLPFFKFYWTPSHLTSGIDIFDDSFGSFFLWK